MSSRPRQQAARRQLGGIGMGREAAWRRVQHELIRSKLQIVTLTRRRRALAAGEVMMILRRRLVRRPNCSRQLVRFWVSWSVAPIAMLPAAAIASACNHEKVVPIKFELGTQCWHYRGNATTFRQFCERTDG
jgi:hypothetical protein